MRLVVGLIKSEEKLMSELATMAKDMRQPEDTLRFLSDIITWLRRDSTTIESIAGVVRMYVLQPITRTNGKRREATSILIDLLRHVGDLEAEYFESYINMFEKDMNKKGRSFFIKTSED